MALFGTSFVVLAGLKIVTKDRPHLARYTRYIPSGYVSTSDAAAVVSRNSRIAMAPLCAGSRSQSVSSTRPRSRSRASSAASSRSTTRAVPPARPRPRAKWAPQARRRISSTSPSSSSPRASCSARVWPASSASPRRAPAPSRSVAGAADWPGEATAPAADADARSNCIVIIITRNDPRTAVDRLRSTAGGPPSSPPTHRCCPA